VKVPSRKEVFKDRDDRFGRMDPFSKVGLAAIAMALEDAGIAGDLEQNRTAGITASTQRGCIGTDVDFFHTVLADNGQWPSPHLFTYTLANCFLGEAALRFNLTGPSYILHEENTFSLAGVRAALVELADKDADLMIAGACDLSLPHKLLSDFDGRCPGPAGAAFIVLSPARRTGSDGHALVQEKAGDIFVDGEAVSSLTELICRGQRT
ncbi:MAG: beta-ketoacyl synthase N-terminal-like domain-containing protein, partial [Desulfonatronovibrio sp.]